MGSEDEAELGHENDLFGTPGRGDLPPQISPRRERAPPLGIVPFAPPSSAQMATFDGGAIMQMLERCLAENRRLTAESGKRPRQDKDEEDEGEPPIKLYIPEGYDDGWTHINNESRKGHTGLGANGDTDGGKCDSEKDARQGSPFDHQNVFPHES